MSLRLSGAHLKSVWKTFSCQFRGNIYKYKLSEAQWWNMLSICAEHIRVLLPLWLCLFHWWVIDRRRANYLVLNRVCLSSRTCSRLGSDVVCHVPISLPVALRLHGKEPGCAGDWRSCQYPVPNTHAHARTITSVHTKGTLHPPSKYMHIYSTAVCVALSLSLSLSLWDTHTHTHTHTHSHTQMVKNYAHILCIPTQRCTHMGTRRHVVSQDASEVRRTREPVYSTFDLWLMTSADKSLFPLQPTQRPSSFKPDLSLSIISQAIHHKANMCVHNF